MVVSIVFSFFFSFFFFQVQACTQLHAHTLPHALRVHSVSVCGVEQHNTLQSVARSLISSILRTKNSLNLSGSDLREIFEESIVSRNMPLI